MLGTGLRLINDLLGFVETYAGGLFFNPSVILRLVDTSQKVSGRIEFLTALARGRTGFLCCQRIGFCFCIEMYGISLFRISRSGLEMSLTVIIVYRILMLLFIKSTKVH